MKRLAGATYRLVTSLGNMLKLEGRGGRRRDNKSKLRVLQFYRLVAQKYSSCSPH